MACTFVAGHLPGSDWDARIVGHRTASTTGFAFNSGRMGKDPFDGRLAIRAFRVDVVAGE